LAITEQLEVIKGFIYKINFDYLRYKWI